MARLDIPGEEDRRFVISLFLVDDTISVFEQQLRNSGIMTGKFADRRKVRSLDGSRYLNGHDIVVGAPLNLGGHNFFVFDADEFAFNFMYDNKVMHKIILIGLKCICLYLLSRLY
jgi:hypothetical protein